MSVIRQKLRKEKTLLTLVIAFSFTCDNSTGNEGGGDGLHVVFPFGLSVRRAVCNWVRPGALPAIYHDFRARRDQGTAANHVQIQSSQNNSAEMCGWRALVNFLPV